MSPEERLKELASSKQEMWRVLTLLGMSLQTVEQAMAFRSEHPQQEEPRPRRASSPAASCPALSQ